MKMDFSLTYNPKMEYNEIGYHTTRIIYKDDIVDKGFKPSTDKDDWLGEGIYFWDNERNAYWWKQRSNFKKCIFICSLKCPLQNYLNLDDKNQMEKFSSFSKEYLFQMFKNSIKKPKFENNNQKKKFFCDIYCSNNNIHILSFTFEHDTINEFGFKIGSYKRRQICVREPSCISIMNIKE